VSHNPPLLLLSALLTVMVTLFALRDEPAAAAESPESVPAAVYREGEPSADGIGKWFHGREIARIMGHPGIGWLEREEREREEAPGKVISALELAPGSTIADVGAGSGYYTFRIAQAYPETRVVAVDVQPEMIAFLEKRAAEAELKNVATNLGKADDLDLPEGSLDAALLVDAYHEFSHPAEMLASLRRALKPGGRVYLIEYRGEDDRVPIKPLHKMTEAQARLEWESAGFTFHSIRRHLPWQHFMVFQRPL
jgi:SAM-dependent methyltransferase